MKMQQPGAMYIVAVLACGLLSCAGADECIDLQERYDEFTGAFECGESLTLLSDERFVVAECLLAHKADCTASRGKIIASVDDVISVYALITDDACRVTVFSFESPGSPDVSYSGKSCSALMGAMTAEGFVVSGCGPQHDYPFCD